MMNIGMHLNLGIYGCSGMANPYSKRIFQCRPVCSKSPGNRDRKSTRLNSSHQIISYAVFCLQKQNDRKSTRLNSSNQIISYAVFCLKKKKKLRDELWMSLNALKRHAGSACAAQKSACSEVELVHVFF